MRQWVFEQIPFNFGPNLKDNGKCGRGTLRVGISTAGVANTDFTISHNLGRIPVHYHQIRSQKGGQLYDGTNFGTDWTKTTIVFRSTVATDVITVYIN